MKKIFFLFFILMICCSIYAKSEKSSFKIYNGDSDKDFNLLTNYKTCLHIIDNNNKKLDVANFTWKSSNDKIIYVDKYGKVLPMDFGEAIITATDSKGESDSIKVTVNKPKKIKIDVLDNINYSQEFNNNINLPLKTSYSQLGVFDENNNSISNDLYNSHFIKWSTSNKKIVTIDKRGYLTPIKCGKATITATASNGVTASINVNVTLFPKKILIGGHYWINNTYIGNYNDIKLNYGEETTLKSYNESGIEIKNYLIHWKSSNEKIVSIDEKGKINTKGFGEAIITATCGTTSGNIKITVNPTNIKIGKACYDYKTDKPIIDFNDFTIYDGVDEKVYLGCCDEDGNALFAIDPTEIQNDKFIKYSSSNEKIIKFNNNNMEIKDLGETIITATYLPNGLTDTIKVTVALPEKIKIGRKNNDNIIDYNDFEITCGTYKYINAFDKNNSIISNEGITWKSSNDKIISIDKRGKIIAEDFGEAIITATLPNGASDSKKVTVTNPLTLAKNKIAHISYSYNSSYFEYGDFELKIGDTKTVCYINQFMKNENIDINKIKWSSSNDKIITIDQSGIITGLGIGEANINLYYENSWPPISSVKVTVVNDNIKIGRKVDFSEYLFGDFNLSLGSKIQLDLVNDNNNHLGSYYYSLSNVIWSSSNDKIITIDQFGIITGLGIGEATITATLKSEAFATIKINVTEPKVKICKSDYYYSGYYDYYKKNYCFDDSDFTVNYGDWIKLIVVDNTGRVLSSNEYKLQCCDKKGYAHSIAYKIGEMPFTVTLPNGATDTLIVTVLGEKATGIKLDNNSVNLNVSDTYQLVETILPEYASNQNVTWTSSDESVATVTGFGLVKAKGAGKAIITVKSIDGDFTDTCEVNVTKPNKK